MRTVVIYALCEPTSHAVRYVGKAINLKRRFWDHLCCDDNTHRGCWLRSIISKGLRPHVIVLETVPETEWQSAERRWIAYHRAAGADLINATDGGDGVTMTDDIRKKIGDSHRGRKHTGKALANMRNGHKHLIGKKHSDEHKAKISAAIRKRPPASEETKRRISEAKRGWKMSQRQKEQVAAFHKGRKASNATRQKMSKSQRGKKRTVETRARMVAAWKLRKAAKRGAHQLTLWSE